MTAFKNRLKDSSLFRKSYIITLFFCNIAFLQIPAYAVLVFLFIWGVGLTVYNQRKNNTLLNLRFGLWIGAFLTVSTISMLLNFSATILFSLVMLLHVGICFLIFYGMHTEPNFDFKVEFYSIARFIVFATTIANIIGIVCLMFGFSFEWYWIKFTIYENRFTGVYVNPNLLGFISVISVICCHMLYKPDFMNTVGKPRISKIIIIPCVITNLFSLILCDSNASMVLALGYAVVYMTYLFFSDRPFKFSKTKIALRITAAILTGAFLIGSVLMFRLIFQAGFSVVVSKTSSIITMLTNDEDITTEVVKNNNSKNENTTDEKVTFGHENKNIDSGRFKLWKESVNLIKLSPIVGISHGNIVFYSGEYSKGTLSYSYHQSDLHNGFLTILVSTGAIGFLLFGIFGFRFAKHSAQHLFLSRRSFKNDIYPCLFAFLLSYVVYSLFEKALLYDISFLVMWFWLMMGYMSCYIAKFEPLLERKYLFHRKRLKRTLL